MVTNYYLMERADVLALLRSEAARFRERREGADEAVAAHFEIVADQIARGDHEGMGKREES